MDDCGTKKMIYTLTIFVSFLLLFHIDQFQIRPFQTQMMFIFILIKQQTSSSENQMKMKQIIFMMIVEEIQESKIQKNSLGDFQGERLEASFTRPFNFNKTLPCWNFEHRALNASGHLDIHVSQVGHRSCEHIRYKQIPVWKKTIERITGKNS